MTRELLQFAERLVDDLPQNVGLAVLLEPREDATGQLRKVVHRKQVERFEHFIDDGLKLMQRFD